MGGIASWSTPIRLWFVAHLYTLSTNLGFDCWESSKSVLSSYLWWDYVCDQPAIELYQESYTGHRQKIKQLT